MLSSIGTHPFKADNPAFAERAAQFKAITGRDIVIETNADGEFIHMFSPESTQRLGFFGEFFRVGFNHPDGFEATLKSLAQKFVELREELLERYDCEDELYAQMGRLNSAFEVALGNTSRPTIPEMPHVGLITSESSQAEREAARRAWAEYEMLKSFMQTLSQNLTRHVDRFFETFIKSIQITDFESAFQHSMDVLSNTESTSLAFLSFRDSVLIRDALAQGQHVRDADGNKVFRLISPEVALREVVRDPRASDVLREGLTELLGLMFIPR